MALQLQPRSGHSKSKSPVFSKKVKAAVTYHSKFNYPLTKQELEKWKVGKLFPLAKYQKEITFKEGFYFVKGKNEVASRLKREKYSTKKRNIAHKAVVFLAKIPTIKFVGITGSLAMSNADRNSDIDVMIITSSNTLWLTRGVTLILMKLCGFKLRSAGDKNEKDKLCFNLWLDESDLVWRERNEFTAHEIVQIVSLVNKDTIFEKFLYKNKWILDFWSNGARIVKSKIDIYEVNFLLSFLNVVAFKLQYTYMKSKMTNEFVSKTRGCFHPQKLT